VVLLTPGVLGKLDWQHHDLPTELTQAEVKSSPDIDSDAPVSRQREALCCLDAGRQEQQHDRC